MKITRIWRVCMRTLRIHELVTVFLRPLHSCPTIVARESQEPPFSSRSICVSAARIFWLPMLIVCDRPFVQRCDTSPSSSNRLSYCQTTCIQSGRCPKAIPNTRRDGGASKPISHLGGKPKHCVEATWCVESGTSGKDDSGSITFGVCPTSNAARTTAGKTR